MDKTNISDPQINPPSQESVNTNSNSQILNNNPNINTKRNKSYLIIGILVVLVIIAVGVYFLSLKSNKDVIKTPVKLTPILEDKTNPEEGKYIIFQDKKVALGDTFNFSPKDSCVEDTLATLSAITKDTITFKIKEWNWKNDLNTSIEEITDYNIKDKDCIGARPKCMDVGYEYCFSLSNLDSIQNVTYKLKGRNTMPPPPEP